MWEGLGDSLEKRDQGAERVLRVFHYRPRQNVHRLYSRFLPCTCDVLTYMFLHVFLTGPMSLPLVVDDFAHEQAITAEGRGSYRGGRTSVGLEWVSYDPTRTHQDFRCPEPSSYLPRFIRRDR